MRIVYQFVSQHKVPREFDDMPKPLEIVASLETCVGIVPQSTLDWRVKLPVRRDSRPSSLGTTPEREARDRSKLFVRRVRRPSSDGTAPLIAVECNLKFCNMTVIRPS